MPIDYSRVNVSLQQFQKISSGKYNAGEVKLSSETKLGKVNNHVSRIGNNVVPLSHEEVMAVKEAFIKALRSGGVSPEEINRVRRDLGLAPRPEGEGVDRTLGQRSMKPLTRRQVREILDRNAETINAHPGGPRIRTSDEIYRRVANADRNTRAARRDEVNASLEVSRTVSPNREILLFERLVAGDFEGIFGEDAERMSEMARQKLASAREKYGDHPPANDRLRVGLRLPGGQGIEIATNRSTAEFVAYLEDALFFLSIERPERGNGEIPPPPPPPPSAEDWNATLKSALLADRPEPLPRDVAAMEKALLAEARAKFGADVIRQGIRLRDIIYGPISTEFNAAAAAAGNRRIGVDDLRDRFRNALNRFGAMTLAGRRLEQAAAAKGVTNVTLADKHGFIARNPALLDAIVQADSPAAIAQMLDGAQETVEKMAGLLAKIQDLKATITARGAAALAPKCNLPESALASLPSVTKLLVNQASALATKLVAGKEVVCDSDEDAEKAFHEMVEDFSEGLPAELVKTDAVIRDRNLSPVAADALRKLVCGLQKYDTNVFNIEKLPALADTLRSSFNSLLTALCDKDISADDGLQAIKAFVESSLILAKVQMPKIDEAAEKMNVFHALLLIAFDGDFAAIAPILDFCARDDVKPKLPLNNSATLLHGTAAALKGHLDPRTANANLLAVLGTSKTPPFHAAALVKAARAAGLTAMSEADILALFAPGKPAGKLLAEAIGDSPVVITPEILEGFVRNALTPFADAIHDGVASHALSAPEADFPPEARNRAPDAYLKAGAAPWKADALVAAAFGACGGDADLRALVMDNLDHILVGGNAQLRSEASVRRTVADLAANFAELRKLAENDPALLAQGRDLIAGMHGKPLPRGLIGRLVQAAWEQPNAALKGLGARSKGLAVHKAVLQFLRSLEGAFRESGAEDSIEGADQLSVCKDFLLRRFLSGLSRADVEGLHAALHSQAGSKLLSAYAGASELAAGMPISEGVRENVASIGNQMRMRMFELNIALCGHLGIEEDALQPYEADEPPQPSSFGAAGLVEDIVALARERIAAEKKEAINAHVRGDGPAARRLRDLLETRLGPEPGSPDSTLNDNFQGITGAMLKRAVLGEMKNFATGAQTQFDLDRDRDATVTLAGVGQVSKDPAVARDQFAKFVTRNPAATYASLNAQQRTKAAFAMAFATQGTGSAIEGGFSVMLDPESRHAKSSYTGAFTSRSIEMWFEPTGDLSIRYQAERAPTFAILENEPVPCGPGSKVTTAADIHVNPQELERISNIPFATYDDHPVSQIVDQGDEPDKYRQAMFALPGHFHLGIECGPKLVADLR